MKKLLGISLIAILTAGPAFADLPQVLTQQPAIGGGADDVATTDPTWKMVAATEADASTVATTSYVKGAYNAGLKATNKIHERVGNLSNLNDSLVEKNNQGEITSDITDAINAVNTKAVNAQTAANSKLSAGDITEGEVDGTIKVGTTNVAVKNAVNTTKLGAGEDGYDIDAKTLKVQGDPVLTKDGIQGMTGKTIDATQNTISGLNKGNFAENVVVATIAGEDASVDKIASEKAVRDAINGLSSTYATAEQGTKADTAVQPGDLATVATSGNYADLADRPTLGTAAAKDTTDFASAEQGTKADNAETAIATLNGDGDGSINKKIIEQAHNATFTAEAGFDDGVSTIEQGLNDLNARVGNSVVKSRLETTAENATDGYDINAKTLKVAGKGVINEDMVGISDTGKSWIHEQVHNEAGKSTYSDEANAYGAGTLGKKVQDLDTAVSSLGNTYATKEGVKSTIKGMNATVTANAVWGSNDTTPVPVVVPETVEYIEPEQNNG